MTLNGGCIIFGLKGVNYTPQCKKVAMKLQDQMLKSREDERNTLRLCSVSPLRECKAEIVVNLA